MLLVSQTQCGSPTLYGHGDRNLRDGWINKTKISKAQRNAKRGKWDQDRLLAPSFETMSAKTAKHWLSDLVQSERIIETLIGCALCYVRPIKWSKIAPEVPRHTSIVIKMEKSTSRGLETWKVQSAFRSNLNNKKVFLLLTSKETIIESVF